MALVRFASSRKLPLLFCSRNVDQFDLRGFGSLRAAFFSTQKLIGDEPVLVSFFFIYPSFSSPRGFCLLAQKIILYENGRP